MKIAILGPVFTKTYFGGVATFDENLAIGFKQLGHKPILMSHQKDKPAKSRNGIMIVSPKDLNNESYDLVIASVAYGKYLSRINAKTKIYFLHGFHYIPKEGILKTLGLVLFQRYYAKQCQYVISNSQLTHFVNKYMYGIDSSGSVRLGVSDDFIKIINRDQGTTHKKKHTILYVGRLTTKLKMGKVLEAMKLLKESGRDDYTLTVVGDGIARKELEDYANRYNLNVVFVGRAEQEQTINYYKRSDVFVSLSPTEPFGITYCEALLSGCKIICSKTGGQTEFLGTYDDRVAMVDEQNSEEIANSIIKLSSMPTPRKNVKVEDFSYKTTAKQILEIVTRGSKGQ